jgi:PAS domain-containing protein
LSVALTSILLVEDSAGDASLVRHALEDGAPEATLTVVATIVDAVKALNEVPFECVLLDLGLPDAYGLDGLVTLLSTFPPPIVVLTGLCDQTLALAAISKGAEDYLVKAGLSPESLARAIRYAVERRRAADLLRDQADMLREQDDLLRDQAGRYRSILESLGEGLVVYDRDGKVLRHNSAAERILGSAEHLSCLTGVTGDVVLIRPDGTLVDGPDAPVPVALCSKTPTSDVTFGIKLPSGEVRWLSVNSIPVWERDEGADMAVVVSFQDITTTRQAQRRVQLGFEQSGIGLALADGAGRFTEVNPALCSILGRTKDELLGTALADHANAGHASNYRASQLTSVPGDRHNAELQGYGWRWLVPWSAKLPVRVTGSSK